MGTNLTIVVSSRTRTLLQKETKTTSDITKKLITRNKNKSQGKERTVISERELGQLRVIQKPINKRNQNCIA